MRCGHASGASQVCKYSGSLTIGLILVSVLAACDSETKLGAQYDEVVARVNGEEITVHQLNERLAQLGLPTNDDPRDSRKRLLDLLIDERLLMQKAIARGLDKDLTTRNAIEHARTKLLAQAAIEETSGDQRVSQKETRAFYLANPDVFGNRKVYTFGRFLVDSGNLDRQVKAKLDSAKTSAEVAAMLKASGVKFSQATEVRTAESLPAPILAQAARMAAGDILVFAVGSETVLLQLAGRTDEPVSLEVALPSIQEYLADARRQRNAERLVKDLRRKARIEYLLQTAKSAKPTALAEVKPVLGEPPLKKPLQSEQITVVR
jgi:EpsD family peptidyl-prolyl cis-trans isomerase